MENEQNASEEYSFQQQQQYLMQQIRDGLLEYVFLDPDGTLPPWLAVVVEHPTGVVYGTQAGGTATDLRMVEGFLVPIGGSKFDVDDGYLKSQPFNDVFHEDDGCRYDWTGEKLPPERLAKLSRLVETVPYWRCSVGDKDTRNQLRLDRSRISEIAEAWIPVITPNGPGVLLYDNCD